MEEEKKEPSEPIKEDILEIGSLRLASRTLNVAQLASIAIEILKEKQVQEYLQILRKQNGIKHGQEYCG